MSYVHFYACFLNAPLLNKYHDNTRVIILLWKLRVKNFSKIVVEAILDFRSEHSIQLQVFLRHRASFLLFSFHWSYRDIFGQKLIEKGPERRSKTAYVNNCIIHVVNAVAL
ncbi:uncharacterized protein LOC107797163 isoform X3 [Nicotiana tabacum]|uniref:Uncharacterized protein LOC107797163 isoform X3 n=1 Tax=Nicotiana tabacum TaxID=4097 RepID=A0AC58RT31_TOBAC